MAGETNTEKIAKLERLTVALEERENQHKDLLARVEEELRREVGRVEAGTTEAMKRLQALEKELALCARDGQKLEKRLDELLTRRWELWKLFLAALLGSLLTVAAGWANKSLERLIGRGSDQRAPAGSPASDRR